MSNDSDNDCKFCACTSIAVVLIYKSGITLVRRRTIRKERREEFFSDEDENCDDSIDLQQLRKKGEKFKVKH